MIEPIPLGRLLRQVDHRNRPDLQILSVYRDHGVVPKGSRVDNFNKTPDDTSRYLVVRNGDLVVNKMKAWSGSVAVSQFDGIVSGDYMVCRPGPGLHSAFLHHLLRSSALVGEMRIRSKGIRPSQERLYWQDLADIRVPLPPLEEQRRIADFLDDQTTLIDHAIQLRQRQIELVTDAGAQVIAQAVTRGLDVTAPTRDSGVPWLGSIPLPWNVTRTRYLCTITTGSGDTVDADDDGPFDFYVRSQSALRSSTYEFEGIAVLTAGDGAGVGKVFHIVDGRFMAHQRVYVLMNFERVAARYFYYFFSRFFAQAALDGSAKSTVDSVRRDMIADLPVALPSIGEQTRIIRFLDAETSHRRELTASLSASIELLRERKRSLISAAVTGGVAMTSARHTPGNHG